MKRSTLLFATAFISTAAFAQWTKPTTPTGLAITPGAEVYLYNAEASGFMIGANDWGTHASVGSKGYKMILGKAREDMDDPASAEYTDLYYIQSQVENKDNAWMYMFLNNSTEIYVDFNTTENKVSSQHPYEWQFTAVGSDYVITNAAYSSDYAMGVTQYWQGATGNTRVYLNDPTVTYKTYIDDEEQTVSCMSGEFWSKWTIISEETYLELQPQVELYNAAMSLKNALDVAKEENPNVDFSSVEAVYNNSASTVEELQAAEEAITTLIVEYKSGLANYDDPLDLTNIIGDGSSVTPWTQEFTGTGTIGSHTTNTWSTEANNGADGTDMTTPFCEHWTGSGGILSDQKIYQTLQGCAPGLYKFTVNVRAYSEAGGITEFKGLSMYFGDQKVDLQTQTEMTKSGSKCVLWSKNKFTIIAIVKEMTDIELGFEIKSANFNWLAFKETSLTYYGNKDVEKNAAKLAKDIYSFPNLAGSDCKESYLTEYEAAVEAFNNAESEEEIKTAVKNAEEAEAAVKANIEAYKNLLSKIEEWTKATDRTDLTGDEWDEFVSWIQTSKDDGDEFENYPAAFTKDIADGDRTMTTEEVNEYITTVSLIYSTALAHSLTPGSDCSNMLVNPKFNDPNGGGWTKTGNVTLRGGLHNFPCAESWHSTFDVYQEIDNVPDGIYSVSLNGFCRLDGETKVAGQIYMNDYFTSMQQINDPKHMVSTEEARDGYNCYLSTGSTGAWANNPVFWVDEYGTPCTWNSPNNATDTSEEIDGVTYYAPNGMEGASVAFSAGRYEAKVYGYVTGGKMRLGIRCNSGGQWVLWSNFTLTFEGKTKEALTAVLPGYISTLEEYLNENADYLTEPAKTAANKIVTDAKAELTGGDAESMWEALQDCNKGLIAAVANYDANNELTTLNSTIDNLINEYQGTITEEASEAYSKYSEKVADLSSLTTEQLQALIVEANKLKALIRIPDVTGASVATPIDMTRVLDNPAFEDGTNGWKGDAPSVNNDNLDAEFFNKNYDMYQTITGLKAGYYEVEVQGFYRQGSAYADYLTIKDPENNPANFNARVYISNGTDSNDNGLPQVSKHVLFEDDLIASADDCAAIDTVVVEDVEKFYYVPNTMTTGAFWFASETNDGKAFYSGTRVGIKLEEGQDLTVGLRKTVQIDNDWTLFNDFKLYYTGDEVPTAINTVETSKSSVAAFYTTSGTRVSKLQKGVNIVKMANGEVRKVFVK